MKFFFFIGLLLFFSGCHSQNESFFLSRSEIVQKEILDEFVEVKTLPDLFSKQENITLLFTELASLAIKADQWQKKTKQKIHTTCDSTLTESLEKEMERILRIPGAKSFLEKCQSKGQDMLEAYESKL